MANCDFCGCPGATRLSARNPGELYCADIRACIDRHLRAQPKKPITAIHLPDGFIPQEEEK